MYFAKHGAGENVFVGLHGWSGDHSTFSPLVRYIPDNAVFYSADLPGTGKSPALKDLTIENLAAAIAEGIQSLSHSQITILGSCSGGLFGLFAVKHLLETGQPELVKRIVIIDPYAYFPWYFNIFVAPQMGKIGWYAYYTTFANPIGRWMTNLSLRKHRANDAHLTRSFAETNHQTTYRYLQLLVEGGGAKQFNCIPIPIVIVYGEKTFSAVRKSLSLWKEILPNVTFLELNGAGHLPIEEATSDLANILFIDE